MRPRATIANAAHARGLTIALKNDLNQIPQLVPEFIASAETEQ